MISLRLSRKHSCIYSSLGFHPFWAEEFSGQTLSSYESLIRANKKVIAIGEVGLDQKAQAPLKYQEEIFQGFVKLALKMDLPLLIHNRMDSLRILEILDQFVSSYQKVIFHCFSYSRDFLELILNKKGLVSFSPNILREKKSLLEALKDYPQENLFLETDAPYMKIKTESSKPQDITKVYSFTAKLKGIPEEKLAQAIFSNAKKLFPSLGKQ